jgi:integrase
VRNVKGLHEAMSAAYVRRLLKQLARKAGIDKRVHAHGFRHTHAAQLRAEGVDIAIISKQLGHASISTTARYLDHLAPRAVIEAMRKRSWTDA